MEDLKELLMEFKRWGVAGTGAMKRCFKRFDNWLHHFHLWCFVNGHQDLIDIKSGTIQCKRCGKVER